MNIKEVGQKFTDISHFLAHAEISLVEKIHDLLNPETATTAVSLTAEEVTSLAKLKETPAEASTSIPEVKEVKEEAPASDSAPVSEAAPQGEENPNQVQA